MATIWPMTGLISELDFILTETYTMHLFQNDYVPGMGTEVGNFDEADFSGYAPVVLGEWTGAAFDGVARAISHANQAQFTHVVGAVANDIYGYYVVDSLGVLCWCERFTTAPIPMVNNGDTFGVVPYATARSEF